MLASIALGTVIGLLLGGLGGGGGVLVVPGLVYLLGVSVQEATTSSLVIVGLTSVVALATRLRAGQVDWRRGVVFGLAGIPAAHLGTQLSHAVAQNLLMLAFAGLAVAAAATMLFERRAPRRPTVDPVEPAVRNRVKVAGQICGGGLAIGFLTGFLGVGGGFLVVPVLTALFRMRMAVAVGTSLLIIVVNSAASLASRLGTAHVDWSLIGPFAAAAMICAVTGQRASDHLPARTLSRCFAGLLLAVGAAVAAQSLGGLALT